MNKTQTSKFPWFQVFKYLVYGLLALDVYMFFVEEFSATSFRFAKGLSLSEIIVAYSGTIDTAAWVILLIVFELETYVIDDKKLKGGLKWLLNGISFLSYVVIVYSFYAYNQKLIWTYDFQQIGEAADVCNYIGQSWLMELDHFTQITANNCGSLATSTELWAIPDQNIVADINTLTLTKRLALTDVLNSAAWLLVVIVLEVDVWLQLKHKLKGGLYLINKIIKFFAYFLLILAAIYWGYTGQILDFWDAFLWIVSFLIIEMNLFKWHEETEEEDAIKETLF
jgi:hypothetical protein